jgi:hypothetical protein
MHQELGAGSVKLSWHGRSKHVMGETGNSFFVGLSENVV